MKVQYILLTLCSVYSIIAKPILSNDDKQSNLVPRSTEDETYNGPVIDISKIMNHPVPSSLLISDDKKTFKDDEEYEETIDVEPHIATSPKNIDETPDFVDDPKRIEEEPVEEGETVTIEPVLLSSKDKIKTSKTPSKSTDEYEETIDVEPHVATSPKNIDETPDFVDDPKRIEEEPVEEEETVTIEPVLLSNNINVKSSVNAVVDEEEDNNLNSSDVEINDDDYINSSDIEFNDDDYVHSSDIEYGDDDYVHSSDIEYGDEVEVKPNIPKILPKMPSGFPKFNKFTNFPGFLKDHGPRTIPTPPPNTSSGFDGSSIPARVVNPKTE